MMETEQIEKLSDLCGRRAKEDYLYLVAEYDPTESDIVLDKRLKTMSVVAHTTLMLKRLQVKREKLSPDQFKSLVAIVSHKSGMDMFLQCEADKTKIPIVISEITRLKGEMIIVVLNNEFVMQQKDESSFSFCKFEELDDIDQILLKREPTELQGS